MEGPGESQQTVGETIGSGLSKYEIHVCVCVKKGGWLQGIRGDLANCQSPLCVGICGGMSE